MLDKWLSEYSDSFEGFIFYNLYLNAKSSKHVFSMHSLISPSHFIPSDKIFVLFANKLHLPF